MKMRIIISLMIFNNDLTASPATDGLEYVHRTDTAHILQADYDWFMAHDYFENLSPEQNLDQCLCAANQGRLFTSSETPKAQRTVHTPFSFFVICSFSWIEWNAYESHKWMFQNERFCYQWISTSFNFKPCSGFF